MKGLVFVENASLVTVMQGAFNDWAFVCTHVFFVQDIDHLQQVWEITQEWNANWNIWKVGQFATLRMESMEGTAQDMFKKLHKLQRELKVSSATQTLLNSCRFWLPATVWQPHCLAIIYYLGQLRFCFIQTIQLINTVRSRSCALVMAFVERTQNTLHL